MRGVLDELVAAAAPWREKEIAATLGLDRSVVGRLVRASRAGTDLELLHELPSAEGLSLIVNAAEQRGWLTADGAGAARVVVADFDAFLDAFPGKRRAFLLRVASEVPGVRDAADRTARRAMYRASSELLGYRMRHAALAMLVLDGEDKDRFDTLHIAAKYGLERIRADGPPIVIGSLRTGPDGPAFEYTPAGSGGGGRGATDALLLEYSSGPAELALVRTSSGHTELHLAAEQPALHEAADILCAQNIPATLLREAREGYSHEWRRTVTRIPCEHLTVDFIFGPGVYERSALSVSEHLYRGEPPVRPAEDSRAAEQLRASAQIQEISGGIVGLAIPGCDRYEQAVGNLVEGAGVELPECRVVRVTKEFPELNSEVVCWISLPEAG